MATTPEWAPSNAALLALSAPTLGTGAISIAVLGILPTVLATEFSVPLVFIGLVLACGRIVDALIDPVIGYLSDRTRSRLGRRRVWVAAGLIVFIMSSYMLLVPPRAPSKAYVLVGYLAFFVGWAMIEIPHSAWTAEVSREPRVRNRAFVFRQIAGGLGAVLFAVAPHFAGGNGQMNSQVLARVALAMGITLPVLGAIALFGMPDRGDPTATTMPSVRATLRAVRSNGPFWNFVGVFLIAGLGFGLYSGLYFLYIQTYLGIGGAISTIIVVMTLSTVVAIPIWAVVIARVGKIRAWASGLVAIAVINIAMAFIEPGPNASVYYIALLVVMGLCAGTNAVVPYALLADITDYDTLKSGEQRTGSYYAILMLIVKVNLAGGAGLGFVLLQVLGYDPTAASHTQAQVWALKACALLLPACLMIISAVWILGFPLDARRHAIIRRRLQKRASVAAVATTDRG